MLICPNCETKNDPQKETCTKCGADLLPGDSFKDRIGNVIAGVIGGVLAGLAGYYLVTHPEFMASSELCLLSQPAAWFFAAIAVPVTGITTALKKTPIYARYERRALRHIEQEPEQAVADYTKALELAPENKRAPILRARSTLFVKLDKEELALKDNLAYMSSNGAYEGGADLARIFGADKDTFVSARVKAERKQMMADGKIIGLGYCKKCNAAVELNDKFRCSTHPSFKPQITKFVIPSDVEQAKQEIIAEQEGASEKSRSMRKKVILIAVILFSLCAACGIISVLLQK